MPLLLVVVCGVVFLSCGGNNNGNKGGVVTPTSTVAPAVTPTHTLAPAVTPTHTLAPAATPTRTLAPAVTLTPTLAPTFTPTVDDLNVPISICQPENGPFSLNIDNPYLPFTVGAVHVLEGMEADGHFTHSEIEVLDETREVAGVTTRIVKKTSMDDGVLVGVGQDFYAQAPDGTVCLFGGEEDIYEDGEFLETDGWMVGEDGALAAVFMPGSPKVGQIFEIFHDEDGVETGEITFLGEPTETPAGTFSDTLTVLETGPSIKKYARGIGEIYDDGIELISY